MGNDASTHKYAVNAMQSEKDTNKMSCATFATQSSDDASLEALVEATREETSEPPRRNVFSMLFGSSQAPQQPKQQEPPSLPPIQTRLGHCETDEQHRAYVSQFLDRAKDLQGEGLRKVGFEFKKIYCLKHKPQDHHDAGTQEEKKCDFDLEQSTLPVQLKQNLYSQVETNDTVYCSPCKHCATRLHHIDTNTCITDENRKLFIADGEMYEQVTRLAQECAQEAMRRAGNLEWITVCDDPAHEEPVRALVHEDHHLVTKGKEDTADDHPTLLIATGKGKVRAGIFSRQHLLTSGMEASTALPMVVEATRRQMSVVIFDPNARGDRHGMTTFEKSFQVVLGHLDHTTAQDYAPSKRALYIVAHSASGSQLVRFLLDKTHGYVPYLRAIAFTDSTHNIQWTRKNAALQSLLGSKRCVYFRSASKDHDELWHTRKVGDAVETDDFWKHRFGGIKTVWAGTEEHSLMNWFAHGHIWDHFDHHLHKDEHGDSTLQESTEIAS